MTTTTAPTDPPSLGLLHRIPGLETAHTWAGAYLSPVRLEILLHLFKHGEQAVVQIAHGLSVDRSSISHALRCLRDDGLVDVRSIDRRRLYQLTERVRIETDGEHFSLAVSREDGWEMTLGRSIPKPMQLIATEPKPREAEVVVRAITPG